MKPAPLSPLARHLATGAALAALAVATLPPAHAQNGALEPTFGVVTEGAGFGQNSIPIQAGGDRDAATLAPGCNGWIADAPDLVFDYGGTAPLFIGARSAFDTTLVVETPGGQTLCNDDFDAVSLDPGLQIENAEPGRYTIWIGSFDPIENETYPDADILLREEPAAQRTTPAPADNACAPACTADGRLGDRPSSSAHLWRINTCPRADRRHGDPA